MTAVVKSNDEAIPLQRQNETLQTVILILVVIGFSCVVSSILPYGIAFCMGVICGKAGFVSLVRFSASSISDLAALMFNRTSHVKPDATVNVEEITGSHTPEIQHSDAVEYVGSTDVTRRDSPNRLRERQFGNIATSMRGYAPFISQRTRNNWVDDIAEDDGVIRVDTAQSRRDMHRRGDNMGYEEAPLDFGHIIKSIGSQILNQYRS